MTNSKKIFNFVIYALTLGMLSLTGCAAMHSGNTNPNTTAADTESAKNEPYFPTNFNDFEVPSELKIDSKHTMFINTSSFKGGIIVLDGRVEMSSLADFFINSMQKNDWHLTGEVRYNNILLSFTKTNKSCMISIYGDSYNYKTKVNVYITDSTPSQM